MNDMAMTIAQALRKLKKLKGQLAECTKRASASVSYKETAAPAYAFPSLFEQAVVLRAQIVALESAVAKTNARVVLNDVMPLVQAVRELQELKAEIAWLKTLPVLAHEETTVEETEFSYEDNKRYHRQIKWCCTLPEAKRNAIVDDLQARFDALNDLVERANQSEQIDAI